MEMQQFDLANLPTHIERNNPQANKMELPPPHSKESVAYYRDPFNRPEHEHTLRGMELFLFTIFYILGVCTIVALFEKVMPVMWDYQQHFLEQQRREAIYNANNREKL